MKIQEYHFLLEKYDAGEISEEEILERLRSADPEFKEEFEKHKCAVLGIKSHAFLAELREIMGTDGS